MPTRSSAAVFFFLVALFPLAHAQNTPNPWSASQTVKPGDLLRELSDPEKAPTVLFVGFQRLYTAGHVKGAQYHGSGGNAEGLAQIKSWAQSQPRSTNLIIYCGCCPMERCPNIRPAFEALRDLGFTKLRVLDLPTSFEVDWADKGFPYDKRQ
jgi:hypothetical protein